MARKRFTFFRSIQVLFLKPARLRWGRSLRLFTILFVAVLLSLFAANVKAQSGLNLEKSGLSHSLISWEKGDEFSVISGKLGIGNQSRSPQAWEDLARTSYAAGDFPE